jgi:hypothetical protein
MINACIIIGNGPSLKNIPNSALNKLPTFGSNGILLRYVPQYYVAVNPLAIERFKPLIGQANCIKFIREGSDVKAPYVPLKSMPTPLFSYDPVRYVYEGHTVTFVSMQLAFAFEFEVVYLVGVDHKYTFKGAPNEQNTWTGEDTNHFDPKYFKDAEWHNPDLAKSEEAYLLARQAFEDDGRRIINCTPESVLEVFERGVLP